MAGAHVSRHLGQQNVSFDTTRHLVKAMHLLRYELDTVSEPQDSSLAVIVSLAIHSNFTNTVEESRIHLHGLKRIIDLRRGGLASLCASTPQVGNKIRRADLDLALMAGTPTIFGSQSYALPATRYVVPMNRQESNMVLPHPLGETCPALQSAIKDVLALCSYAGRAQLGPFQYQDLIISIFQRLVDFAPLSGPRPLRLLNDICQLSFLAFMTTVIHNKRQTRPTCATLLSNMFWKRLDNFNSDVVSGHAKERSSFRLWLVFIYAVSAPYFEECCEASSSVARRIQMLAETLAIRTWDDVKAHLSVYPWITAFHDEQGREIWDLALAIDKETM